MKQVKNNILEFFLGGYDLEMLTIAELLAVMAPGRFHDKHLSWGAKASAYRSEIEAALARDHAIVLIELPDDMGLLSRVPGDGQKIVLVDHHGERAGKDRPTSLHQVFRMLDAPPQRWTCWFDLVAANDRGFVPAMLKIGATQQEMIHVRTADRAAQGITADQEAQGRQAILQAETLANGRLTIVRLPHDRTAAVADPLMKELGGPGYENLLVISPASLNFFGIGQLVLALNQQYPGGWFGGALPDYGFWGHGEPVPDIVPFLLDHLSR